MNLEEFNRFAQSKGWKRVSGSAYGVYNGYPFSAQFRPASGGVISAGLRADGKNGGKCVKAARKALPKGCSLVMNAADSAYTLSVTARGGDLPAAFLASMDTVTGAMRDMGLHAPETCPVCKRGGCEATALLGGGYVPVHRVCVEQHGASAQARAAKALQGNYLTGFLGAILGGVVGAVPAVLCLNFMNYYVAILYALIPLAAYHGYRICKGRMNGGALAGAVLSSILNLFTVEFLGVFIQLGQIRGDIPTFGFAWRVFLDYVRGGGFIASAVMDVVFLGLGLWITWKQIRRTAVHDVQDAGLAAASLLVNGRDPDPGAAAAPGADGGYRMVPPAAPCPGPAEDPWDQ